VQTCPLPKKCPRKDPSKSCPLGKNCYMFPTGRLKEQLKGWSTYLGSSVDAFRDDSDLLNAINQLRTDISSVLTKLG
jgi:hypothetical protein